MEDNVIILFAASIGLAVLWIIYELSRTRVEDISFILAHRIINESYNNTLRTIKIIQKINSKIHIDDEIKEAVFLEYLSLLVHVTDRFAFYRIEKEKRDYLMSEITEKTLKIIGKHRKSEADKEFKEALYKLLAVTGTEYAKYEKLLPSGHELEDSGVEIKLNKETPGTLLWEFGKKIARIFQEGEPNIGHIMQVQVISAESVSRMDAERILDRLKK